MSNLPDIVKELRAAEERGELSTSSILHSKTTTLLPVHHKQEDVEKEQASEVISTYYPNSQTSDIQNLFPSDLYKQVIQLSPDGIVTVDIAGIITSCNPAAEKMLGYSSGEIIGKQYTKTGIFHTKDLPHLVWLFANILSGKTQGPFELQYYRKNGSAFWAEVHVTLLKKERRIIGVLAISRDITTRRYAEKKIRASEQRYRELYEGGRDGFALVDIEGKIIESNSTFQKLLGYTTEELTKKTYKEITPSKWHDIEAHILQEQVFNQGYSEIYEKEYIRKDGKIIPIEIRTQLLKEDGKPSGMWAFVRDISDRKQKERELQEATNHFERLFNSMVDPVVIADNHGTILEISDSVVQQTGYAREDLVGKNFLRTKLVTTRSKALLLANLAKRMTGVHIAPYQIEVVSKDGGLLPYEINAAKIAYKGKTADMVVFRDVSERYRVENALRESEEKFRMISEQSLMGIAIIQDNDIKYINEAATQITGYSKEEFKQNGVALISKLIHPDDLSFVMNQLKKKLRRETDAIPHYSYKIITKSGDIRWIDQFSKTISYAGKNADFITIIDVTDKKRAETQLRKSEEKYRNIVELAPNGIAIIDTRGIIQSCNTALLASIGLLKKDIIGKSFTKLPILRKTDLPKYMKIFKNILRGEIPKPFETSWKDIQGRNHYGEIHVSLMKEEDELKAIQVIALDITERKTTIEKEKKYLENMQFLSKSAMEFAQSSDKQDLFEVICQRLEELVPRSRIILFNYNSKEQTFSIRSLAGFQSYFDKILPALQQDVHEFIIPIEAGDWRDQLITGKLTKIPKEIFHKMASKRIPSEAYQHLQKIINPEEVYTMGFIRENQLYGAVILIASKNLRIDNQSIIETFVNQATTALQRRIAEDRIKQQNIQLRKMDKLKSEFLNITSHELRTPMT
ncbi:MAG: PAS domain S-box protein, partial [Candidatus Thermoplasmatota archaeon]|nr:PAS domain S-box protein [Candidatus Thermoplasmatota archaeon]